ncbi:MAG: hypothetical protein R3D34_04940 [Nitratireductor sp.]
MPVYDRSLDDPRGMVHPISWRISPRLRHYIKVGNSCAQAQWYAANLDLKKVGLDKPLGSLKVIRKVLFVPPSMLAADLMARMQATRTQVALVIDEWRNRRPGFA